MEGNNRNLEIITENLRAKKFLQADDKKAERINEIPGKDKPPVYNHRSNYQRDRDRILYTSSFRRLIGKTQIFNPGMGEHFRNRLTHTLQVMQIATTISRSLGLNIDLTEAIAIGHDIGHTPFGHVGERTLNNIMFNCDVLNEFDIELKKEQRGFKHNLQGLRVLCEIERKSRKYNGLDITKETLWGIANHTDIYWNKCNKKNNDNNNCLLRSGHKKAKCPYFKFGKTNINYSFYDKYLLQIPDEKSWSFEAFVVKYADEIAQRHHDIEDGIISNNLEPFDFIEEFNGLFSESDFYSENFKSGHFKDNIDKLKCETKDKNLIELEYLLPMLSGFILDFYVQNYIIFTAEKLNVFIKKQSIKSSEDFQKIKEEIWKKDSEGIREMMTFDKIFEDPDTKLKILLKNRIVNSHKAQEMDAKGSYIIRKLFKTYLAAPNQLPDDVLKIILRGKNLGIKINASKDSIGEFRNDLDKIITKNDNDHLDLCRNICDHISSMTDRYALKQYEKLYGSVNLS